MPPWIISSSPGLDLLIERASILLFVGPAGSGKTSLARMLETMAVGVTVVQMFTTRVMREDDLHYRYLSKAEFDTKAAGGEFFLARTDPFPQYGWSRSHLADILERSETPLFIFRHAGAAVLLNAIPQATLVAIDVSPGVASTRAANRVDSQTDESIALIMQRNQQLLADAERRKWRCIRITNSYSGATELCEHARRIVALIR